MQSVLRLASSAVGRQGLLLLSLIPLIWFHTVVVAGATSIDISVPANGGNGTCSNGNVTAFSYNVTVKGVNKVPLLAVLATNMEAFNALENANLESQSTKNLPGPLNEMSCLQPNITSCSKTFPINRKLRSQKMCILLKSNANVSIDAQIDVIFAYDSANSTNSSNNANTSSTASGAAAGIHTSAYPVLLTVSTMALLALPFLTITL